MPAVCTMPCEYCEWGPKFKECKEWFSSSCKEIYPDLEEDGLAELMQRFNFVGEADAAASKAQSGKAKDPQSEEAKAQAEEHKKKKDKKKGGGGGVRRSPCRTGV